MCTVLYTAQCAVICWGGFGWLPFESHIPMLATTYKQRLLVLYALARTPRSSRTVRSASFSQPEQPFLRIIRTHDRQGNCLFAALAQSHAALNSAQPLSADQEAAAAAKLRYDVVAQLRSSAGFVEGFLDEPLEAYASRMGTSGVWGGEPELAMASIVMDSRIDVYSMHLELISSYDLSDNKADSKAVLPLLYYQDLHYDALASDSNSLQ